MQQNFGEHVAHLEGCAVVVTAHGSNFYSFGSDDIVYNYDCATGQANSNSITNVDREEITAAAVHPRHQNTFVVGTKRGFVRLFRPINKFHLQKAEILFKCDLPIKSLSFHPSGKLLGIAFDNQQAFVYSLKDKRVFSLSEAHKGGCARIFFGGMEYVCSQGQQGNLNIYEISQTGGNSNPQQQSQSQDPFAESEESYSFQFIDKYRIASESMIKKYPFFNAVYANTQSSFGEKMILASGQTYLQVINLTPRSSSYRIQKSIRQHDEILLVELLLIGEKNNSSIVITSTVNSLTIWNYQRKDKLLNIDTVSSFQGFLTSLTQVDTPSGPSFLFTIGIPSNGKLYHFNNQPLFLNQPHQQKAQKPLPKQEFVSRWEQSVLDKLITQYTQFLMEKSFEQYQGAQFLFYNNIGCIIQRAEGDTFTLQLQLHDKSRPKRISLQAKNRPFCRFALKEDIFVAATTIIVIFQCQQHLKQGFDSWQWRWNNIQGVSIGANWIAVCSEDEIKILDYSGNELHSICFDRRFVTMEAYEDMLAVVYHGGPPMWGCQALKMRLYQVTTESFKLDRDVPIFLKPNSLLKWFGFSEEGMIYCQDNLEVVKAYLYDRDEWQPVYSLENTSDRLFIQHISGIDIYGFKLQQKQGEKIQPRVLPRSLPRKIPMQLPSLPIKFLSKEQEVHLKRVKLKNMQICHEQFRYNRWYKLKYGRNKAHLWASYSKSILSADEIKSQKSLLDKLLMKQLKQLVKGLKEGKDFESAAKALMLIVERESHFEETRDAARKLLEIGTTNQLSRIFEDGLFTYEAKRVKCASKLNQVSILEKMLNVMEMA